MLPVMVSPSITAAVSATAVGASLDSIVSAGLTSSLVVEVSPEVESAVTVKSGKFSPLFTNATPASVNVTTPLSLSITKYVASSSLRL